MSKTTQILRSCAIRLMASVIQYSWVLSFDLGLTNNFLYLKEIKFLFFLVCVEGSSDFCSHKPMNRIGTHGDY